jgi:hypothetical protein
MFKAKVSFVRFVRITVIPCCAISSLKGSCFKSDRRYLCRNYFWLSEAQLQLIEPHFSQSDGLPHMDDQLPGQRECHPQPRWVAVCS